MELIANVIVFLLFILLLTVNFRVAFSITLLISASYLLIYFLVRRYLSQIGKDRFIANRKRFNIINEIFNSVKIIKLHNLENLFLTRLNNTQKICYPTNFSNDYRADSKIRNGSSYIWSNHYCNFTF